MRLFDKLFGKKKEMEEMSYMEKMEKYCVICLLLLFLLFPLGAASAKTITVDDSGGADFTKIQSAVNTASEGDPSPLINQFTIFTPFSDNFCYSYLKPFCTHLR
jgi:hypothetical protein